MRKRQKGTPLLTRKARENLGMIFRVIIGILFIFPALLAFVFSFVPDDYLLGLPTWSEIVNHLTLDNYKWLFSNIPVWTYVKNSLIMCAIVVFTHAFFGTLAAYGYAYFKFRGKKLLWNIMIIGMMIPGEVCTICNFLTIKNMGLLSTMVGLTLTSWVSSQTIFMLRQCYLTLPKEMHEAARLDGCSELGYMVRFAVPLSIPTIAATSITTFIGTFNAYLWPLIVARDPSMYTIQIGMGVLFNQEVPMYGRFMAGAVACMIVPILIFVVFQRQIVRGMTNGAVKG